MTADLVLVGFRREAIKVVFSTVGASGEQMEKGRGATGTAAEPPQEDKPPDEGRATTALLILEAPDLAREQKSHQSIS